VIESTWLQRKLNWIAVTDRLPRLRVRVLAAYPQGDVHEAYRDEIGRWWPSINGDGRKATHWMVLPYAPAPSERDRVVALKLEGPSRLRGKKLEGAK